MGRTQDDNDKVDELTSGLDELKTTVEELELETATDIDAERLQPSSRLWNYLRRHPIVVSQEEQPSR